MAINSNGFLFTVVNNSATSTFHTSAPVTTTSILCIINKIDLYAILL